MRNSKTDVERQLRRVAQLGIGQIPSVEEIQRLQDDVRSSLSTNHWFRRLSADLEGCGPSHCRRAQCTEVCAFVAWRRSLRVGPAIYRLISRCDEPAYEVRVVAAFGRAGWGT